MLLAIRLDKKGLNPFISRVMFLTAGYFFPFKFNELKRGVVQKSGVKKVDTIFSLILPETGLYYSVII